ncbi:amino acid ABC transporter permease [Ureibacillus composti]
MNTSYYLGALETIIPKLPITIGMMMLALLGGLIVGTILAIIRIRQKPISNVLATIYISFMRCTPTIVQLFLVFYGLPLFFELMGIDINGWSKFIFAVLALGLHSTAVIAEIMRAAYLSVPAGQFEAAEAVGMTKLQMLRHIVLPQATHIAMPNLGNEAISLLKETSLAFSIGVVDIMGSAQILVNNNYGMNVVEVYVVISILYWLLSIVVGRIVEWSRRRSQNRYRRMANAT